MSKLKSKHKSKRERKEEPVRSTSARVRTSLKSPAKDPFSVREAERYERPIPSREAILALLEARGEMLSEGRIAESLELTEEVDLIALHRRLAAMLRDGQLLQGRRGGLGPVRKLDLKAGTVLANAEGFGFFRADEGGDDLYLSPQQMRAVMHGDRVLASVVGVDRRGRHQGAIVEVLQHRPARLVGRVTLENGVMMVAPDDRRLQQSVLIPANVSMEARDGQIVVAEITRPPTATRGPLGEIRAVLGERLEPSLLVEMAIASHDLPVEWPSEVLAEAAGIPPQVTAAEHQGRVDLRELPLVTIDGEDARDFDDAVYAKPRRGGGYTLLVAIADVSHYVPVGSALDRAAQARSTSTYFPGFVVPMLPEALSNGICSLNPKLERLCMVCEMTVDTEGEVMRSKFYQGVMRSHARLTYDRVWQAVGLGDPDARSELADVLPQLEHLFALYRLLAVQRRRRGAIDFETHEVKFRLDQRGEVVSMGGTERNDAHKLIEECMIAANVQAALYLRKKHIPALYRSHPSPPAEKYEDLTRFLREFKLRLPPLEAVTSLDFSSLLRKVHDWPERELIQSVLLRAQSMATYQAENQGHFGLALEAYAHFTSPIRRYPDLLVHRAICHALSRQGVANYAYAQEAMAELAGQCSKLERRAEEAERDVTERFKCAWMEQHIGSEFAGVVTGVTSFGLFVELDASKVSGLVHISQLSNDYYHFDPVRHMLTGERSGRSYQLGDHVRIQVLRASLEDRKIDFRLVSDASTPPPMATNLPKLPPLPSRLAGTLEMGDKPKSKSFRGAKVKPKHETKINSKKANKPKPKAEVKKAASQRAAKPAVVGPGKQANNKQQGKTS